MTTDVACKWELDERDSGNTMWCVIHDSAHLPKRTGLKAKKLPQNWADDLYERIVAVRRAELAMAELCRLDYQDIYTCHGCNTPILDNDHSLIHGSYHYHNDICLQIAEVKEESHGNSQN